MQKQRQSHGPSFPVCYETAAPKWSMSLAAAARLPRSREAEEPVLKLLAILTLIFVSVTCYATVLSSFNTIDRELAQPVSSPSNPRSPELPVWMQCLAAPERP